MKKEGSGNLKIAIDGRKLIGNRTGIGNYLFGILEELFLVDQKNKYFILAKRYGSYTRP